MADPCTHVIVKMTLLGRDEPAVYVAPREWLDVVREDERLRGWVPDEDAPTYWFIEDPRGAAIAVRAEHVQFFEYTAVDPGQLLFLQATRQLPALQHPEHLLIWLRGRPEPVRWAPPAPRPDGWWPWPAFSRVLQDIPAEDCRFVTQSSGLGFHFRAGDLQVLQYPLKWEEFDRLLDALNAEAEEELAEAEEAMSPKRRSNH